MVQQAGEDVSVKKERVRNNGSLFSKLFWFGLFGFSLVLSVASLFDGGLSKLWNSWVILITMCILIGFINAFIWMFPNKPFWIFGFFLMLFGVFGLYLTGSFSNVGQAAWDGLGILIGFLTLGLLKLAYWWIQRWRGVNSPKKIHDGIGLLFLVFACWIGVSVITVYRQSALTVDLNRFNEAVNERVIVPRELIPPSDLKLGIALSGGGYRAAVFHAGTLHALESLGVYFDKLSTVSGGSIIGAFYAIGGDPVDFKDAVGRGAFNLKKELLLIHNFIGLVCPMRVPIYDIEFLPFCKFDRINIQSSMLDRILFKERQHTERAIEGAPRLVINTTELNFGLLIGLLTDGIIMEGPNKNPIVFRAEAYSPDRVLSLSERVAISGAFPGAFPSVELSVKVQASGDGTRPLRLADGGITDNTGLETLLNLHSQACDPGECPPEYSLDTSWRSDVAFLSDGGAIFGIDNSSGVIPELMRAADIGSMRGNQTVRNQTVPIIALSASERFRGTDTGLEFRSYQDSWGEEMSRPGITTRFRFDPRENYPDAILKRMISLLPKKTYPDAELLLQEYLKIRGENEDIDMQQWRKRVSRMPLDKINMCIDQKKTKNLPDDLKTLPGLCEAAKLRLSIREYSDLLIKNFKDTSTLDDQFGVDRADQLFNLGQILVFLKWSRINRVIKIAAVKQIKDKAL